MEAFSRLVGVSSHLDGGLLHHHIDLVVSLVVGHEHTVALSLTNNHNSLRDIERPQEAPLLPEPYDRKSLRESKQGGSLMADKKAHATTSFKPSKDSGDVSYAYGGKSDLGPWLETPLSSRVSRFRYDHMNNELQVQWRNNKNHGYVYYDVDYSTYQSMARSASKGKFVNSPLNGHDYEPMNPWQLQAPSNTKRKGIVSGRGVLGTDYSSGEDLFLEG